MTSAAAAIALPSESRGFAAEWIRGAEPGWLPRHPAHPEDWASRVEELAGRVPAREVWERAAADGDRLGAGEASRESVRALAEGRALCVTTGQQPGLFLGPLYTVYKAMTAVALARDISRAEKRPVVPVFWSAADDSDFGEVGTACLPGKNLALSRHSLEGGDLPAGGMVGDLGTAGTARALEAALPDLAGRPSTNPILSHLRAALDRAPDHGDVTAALLYDLFRKTGLVVVDGRWPELRRAGAPLFRRWVESRGDAARAVVEAGTALQAAGHRAPIKEASTRNGLFEIRKGLRVPFEGTDEDLLARIDERPESVSPNVLLRAVTQDFLFPNVATVAGPSEIAYHAQLAPEYELLGVPMPVLVPRFEATLVPAGVHRLAERRGEPVESFVRDFDAVMRETADRALPEPLREAMERMEERVREAFDETRTAARDFDPKLEGVLRDTSRRALESVRKARDKVSAAARAAETRRDPAVKSYREFLRPRGVPQERILSALSLFLDSEAHPLECLDGPLAAHLDAVRAGRPVHWLLGFEGRPVESA